MITKMRFDCLNVLSYLKNWDYVFTVRGYDMKDKTVIVDDVGECKRTKIKEIHRMTELSEYVSESGFFRVFTWWLQIGMFTRDKKKFLYKVEKIGGSEAHLHRCATNAAHREEEKMKLGEAGDIIQSMILDSYKQQGGVYKRAAEEYEKEGKLYKQAVAELGEELDR